jgi:cell division protein FtsQ
MIYRYQRSSRRSGPSPSPRREPGWVKNLGRIWGLNSARGGRAKARSKNSMKTTRWPMSRPRMAKVILYLVAPGMIVGLAVWGGSVCVRSVRHSVFFELREIRTAGLERLKKSEVMNHLPSPSGETLFDLNLASLQGDLLTEPWIKEVNVRREYPDTLSVHVVERRPVAVLAGRPDSAIVDDTGSVIEQWPGARQTPSPWAGLPVVHGIDAAALRKRDPRAVTGFSAAMEILRTPSLEPGEDLDLDVGRSDDIRVQRHGYLIRLGGVPFDEKWHLFFSVENEIERRHNEVREVDLRFPRRVIVR